MHFLPSLGGLLLLAQLSLQSPLQLNYPAVPRGPGALRRDLNSTLPAGASSNATTGACAMIRQLQLAQAGGTTGGNRAAGGGGNQTAASPPLGVPVGLAAACLRSVPVDAANSQAFLAGFRNYFQFQSTLAWAADPPAEAGADRAPVDIMAGLDAIAAQVAAGAYANNYEFERALRVLLARLRDGHVNWQSKCLEGNFAFSHDFPIVQLTQDGQSKIYAAYDFASLSGLREGQFEEENSTAPVSAIESIDGVPVVQYLIDYINRVDGAFHDADARFNTLFVRRQTGEIVRGSFGSSMLVPESSSFKVQFENGTTHHVTWKAVVLGDFSNIHSGKDYYQQNCIKQAAPPAEGGDDDPAPSMPPENPEPFVPGYPVPIAKAPHDMASYYTIDDGRVGVLALHTFLAVDATKAYQAFVTSAIEDFAARGVAKVIIDVTGNGGGNIVLGYDTFKQFFPAANPFATSNLRAHRAAELFYREVGEHYANASAQLDTPQAVVQELVSNPFCYAVQLNASEAPFPDWRGAYGPVAANGGEFTNYVRWDLASDDGFGDDFAVTAGAPGRNASWHPPWTPADVVLLGDGVCSSTCTLFAEAMRAAGVPSAVYGGRPASTAFQLVGGVAGSEELGFATLRSIAQDVVHANPEQAAREDWAEFLPGELAMPPASPQAGSLNLRNAFRKGSSVPLEYVYTPADYHFDLTPASFLDVEKLWSDAARVAWGR